MRELTVRIRFTSHSLGNVKSRERDGYVMPRTPEGLVTFMPTWHTANMRMAAQLLGRHGTEVGKIFWDVTVDATLVLDRWYRRYYFNSTGKRRYVQHESFVPGQIVGLNCIVPAAIDDGDFIQLMNLAGKYKGLSPWDPGKFGHFAVESIRPRRGHEPEESDDADSPSLIVL
jgi:hypothetical protein